MHLLLLTTQHVSCSICSKWQSKYWLVYKWQQISAALKAQSLNPWNALNYDIACMHAHMHARTEMRCLERARHTSWCPTPRYLPSRGLSTAWCKSYRMNMACWKRWDRQPRASTKAKPVNKYARTCSCLLLDWQALAINKFYTQAHSDSFNRSCTF